MAVFISFFIGLIVSWVSCFIWFKSSWSDGFYAGCEANDLASSLNSFSRSEQLEEENKRLLKRLQIIKSELDKTNAFIESHMRNCPAMKIDRIDGGGVRLNQLDKAIDLLRRVSLTSSNPEQHCHFCGRYILSGTSHEDSCELMKFLKEVNGR